MALCVCLILLSCKMFNIFSWYTQKGYSIAFHFHECGLCQVHTLLLLSPKDDMCVYFYILPTTTLELLFCIRFYFVLFPCFLTCVWIASCCCFGLFIAAFCGCRAARMGSTICSDEVPMFWVVLSFLLCQSSMFCCGG